MNARRFLVIGLLGAVGCAGTNTQTTVRNQLDVPEMQQGQVQDLSLSRVPKTESDLQDPHQLHVTYASWQEYIGNFDEAQKAYEKALKKNSVSLEAMIGLARIDQHAERTTQAERGFKKALSKHPDSAMAIHALGQFYASQKRFPEAERFLLQAVEKEPRNTGYNYDLGIALAQQGKYEKSLPYMTAAIGEAEALYNIGYLTKERGDVEQSYRYLQAAVKQKPELQQAKFWLSQMSTPVEKLAPGEKPLAVKHVRANVQYEQDKPDSVQKNVLQQVSGETNSQASSPVWRR